MAKGQNTTKTITLNNNRTTTASKSVELIVINNTLVPENNEVEHGVNTKNLKN